MAIKYFGLHWTDDSGTAVQARVDLTSMQVWARHSEKGAEWSKWRRLDVEWTAAGIISGTCEKAVNCDIAACAKRLASPFPIRIRGELEGSANVDGSTPVEILVHFANNGRFAEWEKRLGKLESDDTSADLNRRIAQLEYNQGEIIDKIREILRKGDENGNGDGDWQPGLNRNI